MSTSNVVTRVGAPGSTSYSIPVSIGLANGNPGQPPIETPLVTLPCWRANVAVSLSGALATVTVPNVAFVPTVPTTQFVGVVRIYAVTGPQRAEVGRGRLIGPGLCARASGVPSCDKIEITVQQDLTWPTTLTPAQIAAEFQVEAWGQEATEIEPPTQLIGIGHPSGPPVDWEPVSGISTDLYEAFCTNNSGADAWFYFGDGGFIAGSFGVVSPLYVPNNTTGSLGVELMPIRFVKGLVIAAQSTLGGWQAANKVNFIAFARVA